MKTLMITVTHKLFDDSKLPDGYQVFYVGEDNSYKDGWTICDEGDNIADLHPLYSEMTGQYYAWKNCVDSVDIAGICHYRRYFLSYKRSSSSIWDDVVTLPEIEAILSEYKIILPFVSSKNPQYNKLFKGLKDEEQDQNWIIVRDIVHKEFADYAADFDRVIYGLDQLWCNMFIARKEIFESYCSWIFSLLKKYDNYCEEHGIMQTPRIDAYLCEVLMLVWVRKNIEKNEIYSLDFQNVESPSVSYNDGKIQGRILRRLYCSRFLLCIIKTLKRIIKKVIVRVIDFFFVQKIRRGRCSA